MSLRFSPLPNLNVRAKILILFLALALVSLIITGYVAFWTIGDISRSAETSSLVLGTEALDESTAALVESAQDNLLRIASDQAEITNVLFEDTDTELEILAVQASTLQANPPVRPIIHAYDSNNPPGDPFAATLYYLAPGITISPDSEEFRRPAGMDDLLKGTFDADGNLSSLYIATDSGILRTYPWQPLTNTSFDPRERAWFTGAKKTDGVYWSDPYVDVTDNGLVVTSSKAVTTPSGTWVIATDVTVDEINSAFLNRSLSGKGYAVLLDSKGNIISRPGLSAGNISWDQPFPNENVFESTDPALQALGYNMTAGKTGVERITFGNRESFVAYAPVKSLNWSFAVSMPVDEITAPVEKTQKKILVSTRDAETSINQRTDRILIIFSALFCILILTVIALATYLSRIITRPVDTLKSATLALGEGDLSHRVSLHTGDEFEDLGNSFNHMAADLQKNIDDLKRTTAEKERYTKEMEIAKEIQVTFLPESMPVIPGFEISAITLPAMEIGGDLYDFIPVTGGKWGFVIADVSGKGVSAALYMALCRTLLHASGGGQESPQAAIRQANRQIYEDGRSSMFITTFYAVLDPEKMLLTYVNAGHNPPLLIRGNPPETTLLEGKKGIALGVVEDVNIPVTTITVEQGDLIIMYTDGVTEAFNEHDEYFGEERLIASMYRNQSRPIQEIRDLLLEDIRQFCGTAPQSDDITFIVIRVR
ncbi:SpoIIE family protein phosphatase [Methanoregula sp.]|uniref:SpoIIE family protein phosphatase n=1 Tax=Methanoregula sp. TaxID=2052170 RepID=UPI00236F17A0|nr:SpoIIE family protein phosphatase [Methanoregula sp.]MDD1685860.1 SpoIIE family protein phosphatase [Methanoregula sp.]